MNKSKSILIIWILLHFTAGVFCKKNPSNHEKTLSTLEKVDDFPLYVMTYVGDYHFNKRIFKKTQSSSAPVEYQYASASSWGCTCFASLSHEGNTLLGRNFDWYEHPALLLFTDPPHGYASVSMVDIYYLGFSKDNPPTENSEAILRAPLTPFDGMNNQGLAVGMMAVSHAEKAYKPTRITLTSLEVIRLFLDYAATVEECVELIQHYNIDFSDGPPLHYLLCDSTRRSAVIEFIDGEMHVLWNEHPWQVSTNFNLTGYTETRALSTCWRYKSAWQTLSAKAGYITSDEGVNILRNVSQSSTIWSMIYNCTTLEMHIAMGKKYDQVHSFQWKDHF